MVFRKSSALFDDAELHNIDIILREFPLRSSTWTNMQPTVPVAMDELCILVPILPIKEATSVTNNLLKAYLLSFRIILIFLISTRLLRFQTYP